MQRLGANVKKAVLGLGVLFAVLLVYLYAIPILLFFIAYGSAMGRASLWGLILAVAFWSYRRKASYAKRLAAFSSLLLIGYGCACILRLVFPVEYSHCDFYNRELKGGEKNFDGVEYRVNMCGVFGRRKDGDDEVRLQIFDLRGSLVAERHFGIDWRQAFTPALEDGPGSITYYDAADPDHFDKRIAMPPPD